MTVEELRAERQKLETTLQAFINQEVGKFRDKTGFSPSRIDVDMLEATEWGDKESKYFVGGVSCEVSL